MRHLVPRHNSDDEACMWLATASDAEVIPHIAELLGWLQDLNWPVAPPVAERLARLGPELVAPLLAVLAGQDEGWKYWLVSHLLYRVQDEVYRPLYFRLARMAREPTPAERSAAVHFEVCELLRRRRYGACR